MICFLFAMEKEATPLLEDCEILEASKTGYTRFYLCQRSEKKFLVGITGIGKVFAGSAVSALLLKYPTVGGILNIGVGGSLDAEKAPLLSLVIGEKYVEHDMDTSALGDPIGMVSGINKTYFDGDANLISLLKKAAKKANIATATGNITSGDRFIVSKEERETLKRNFASLSCDMESAAMAQVAYCYQIPFCAARLVSDTGKVPNEYAENCVEASRLGKVVIDNILAII